MALWLVQPALAAGDYATVAGARFASVLPVSKDDNVASVAAFRLQRTPATNGEFLAFVKANPQWQRGAAPELFADAAYLKHWQGPLSLGDAGSAKPVTNVSWFAASAYCESRGGRLPTWHEWEWTAAADERVADARSDPAWRQRILTWYASPGSRELAPVAAGRPNLYGAHDLHGLVWEWVEDFSSLMVSADNREQGDPDLMRFCGTGALTLAQKENYAVLMRVAMLSSLRGSYTGANLGFRCAKDLP